MKGTCTKDAIAFSSSGALLLSADTFGQDFHIFRVLPHPMCPSLGSVHHLYTLHRGETMATVMNDHFPYDSLPKGESTGLGLGLVLSSGLEIKFRDC
jgi:hypothetical protein